MTKTWLLKKIVKEKIHNQIKKNECYSTKMNSAMAEWKTTSGDN